MATAGNRGSDLNNKNLFNQGDVKTQSAYRLCLEEGNACLIRSGWWYLENGGEGSLTHSV